MNNNSIFDEETLGEQRQCVQKVLASALKVRPHHTEELEMLNEWAEKLWVNARILEWIAADLVNVEWGGDDIVLHKAKAG